MWSRVRIKEPGDLPLSVADMRARLRIDGTAEDAELEAFLASAASIIEGPDGVGVALMAQTWTLTLDRWPGQMALPGWPVTGLNAIRYLDGDGQSQALDPTVHFRLVSGSDPALLVRQPAAPALPAVYPVPGAVEIDYTLGHTAPANVDAGLVTALAMLTGHFYENREATTPGKAVDVPFGVEFILNRFRRLVVA